MDRIRALDLINNIRGESRIDAMEYEALHSTLSELRKVTFCRDCKHYDRKSALLGDCIKWKDVDFNILKMCRKIDDYCSYGEPREERENEL